MSKFEDQLNLWRVPAPTPALADRIAREAMQPRRWRKVWYEEATRTLTEWRYGLIYKAVALAACLLIGFGVSYSLGESARHDAEIEELAFIMGL